MLINIISDTEVQVLFATRPPMHITDSSGNAHITALWFFSNTNVPLDEYKYRFLRNQQEEETTQITQKAA